MATLSFQDKITPVNGTSAPVTPNPSTTRLSFASKISPVTPVTPVPTITPKVGAGIAPTTESWGRFGNAIISSEKAVGETLGQSMAVNSKDFANMQASKQQHADAILKTQKQINEDKAQGKDTSHLETILNSAKKIYGTVGNIEDIAPATQKTNLQALGEVGGVGLDVLSAGSYGTAARGAETGVLLTKEAAQTAAKTAAEQAVKTGAEAVKPTLSTTLKTIGKQTAVRSAVGGGIGYASDISQNLQQGKTGTEALTPGLGTAAGIALPVFIGGVKAGIAIGKEEASRFINSLIKPKAANFAYGHNPGQTVSELGITGNSLPDFEKNITTAKNDVGQKIGAVYSNPANNVVRIDVTPDIGKINTAISTAAKGGKNNQTIVTQLMNIKDALLYEHGVDAEGNIIKTGTIPRNLSNLSAQESQDLIQHVSAQTQFTGRASDDKIVNSTLRDIYDGIRDKINTGVSVNNPEIIKLNEQYGNLTSAELAVRNREQIVQRSNMISLKTGGAATAVGAITAIVSGGATIPIVLSGLAGGAVEKALETTAVKTRVAAWLGKESPSVVKIFLQKNPQIAPIFNRVFPNIMGKFMTP